ncbi:hypothetical protein, partial [Oleidesulfovibrio sp.]|uniref:hypothetical protein n=1 Tax=Oleidesulfovibrio sp. TaxID=2909707 RepID=UPI003A894CDD
DSGGWFSRGEKALSDMLGVERGGNDIASVADRMRKLGYGYGANNTLTRNGAVVGKTTPAGGLMTTPESWTADPEHLGLSIKSEAYNKARNDMARSRSMWQHDTSEKERTEEKRHLMSSIPHMNPDQMGLMQQAITDMNPSAMPAGLRAPVADYAQKFGQMPLSLGGVSSALFKGDYRSPEEARRDLETSNPFGINGRHKAVMGAASGLMGPAVAEGIGRTAYSMTGNPVAAQAAGALTSLGLMAATGGVSNPMQGIAGLLDAARKQNQAYGRSTDGPASNSGQPNDNGNKPQWHIQQSMQPPAVGGLMGEPWANPWLDSWNYNA